MNILFLGHYRTNKPSSIISQNLILSIYSHNTDILCKHINNEPASINKINNIIEKLETTDLKEIDCCIQYLDAEYIVGSKRFKKNIGIVDINYDNEQLIYNYTLLDEVWVFSKKHKNMLEKYCSNVKIIPPPSNSIKQSIEFLYEDFGSNLDEFSIANTSKIVKELLSA